MSSFCYQAQRGFAKLQKGFAKNEP